jgi:hypothetical protein
MENQFKLSSDGKRILYYGDNKLIQSVQRMVNNKADYYDNIKYYLRDILEYGCISGLETELIYYEDTIKFYRKHKAAIQDLVKEMCRDMGGTISDLFGDKWNAEDIFAEEDQNQNLLTWFAYEEICQMILDAI